jgi:hypothetical protein
MLRFIPKKRPPAPSSDRRFVDPVAATKIMRELDDIFNKNGIPYCVVGGSLLGCIRHQGFIPWDDDIDLLLNVRDIEDLRDTNFLQDFGYSISERWSPTSFGFIVKKYGVNCDLFPYFRRVERRVETQVGVLRNSLIFPFRRLKFSNFFVSAPQEPIEILDATIKGWNKELVVRTTAHTHKNSTVEKVSWTVPPLVEL